LHLGSTIAFYRHPPNGRRFKPNLRPFRVPGFDHGAAIGLQNAVLYSTRSKILRRGAPIFWGMSASPVTNSLRRKRAEISGMIRDWQSRAHAMRRDLAHIDATLKMFAPDCEPRTIKPLRPYRPRVRLSE